VTGAELDQSGGRDGAFEMQMQLGLGQAADEFLDFRHSFSLACLLLTLNGGGLVVDEGDGPFFAGLIVGDGAGAFACAVDMLILADGHAGLKLAHAGNDLMRVDGGPDDFLPVVVDLVRVVVIEKNVAEILFLAAIDAPMTVA
jgi:hypothetical protein